MALNKVFVQYHKLRPLLFIDKIGISRKVQLDNLFIVGYPSLHSQLNNIASNFSIH